MQNKIDFYIKRNKLKNGNKEILFDNNFITNKSNINFDIYNYFLREYIKNKLKKYSIVIFNNDDIISTKKCINSIIENTYNNFEIISLHSLH